MKKEEIKALARKIRCSLLTNHAKVEEDLNKKWESRRGFRKVMWT